MKIFHAATLGYKHQFIIFQEGNLYTIAGFRRGQEVWKKCNYTYEDVICEVHRIIWESKLIDKINYRIIQNDLGIEQE